MSFNVLVYDAHGGEVYSEFVVNILSVVQLTAFIDQA